LLTPDKPSGVFLSLDGDEAGRGAAQEQEEGGKGTAGGEIKKTRLNTGA
jgi:hypothetical protein